MGLLKRVFLEKGSREEADFWLKRWESNLTGFHLHEVNPYLKTNWPALNLAAGSRVFVPLCGKSIDLLWLAEQGYEVVGIELSQYAAEAFFAENNLQVERRQLGKLELWKSEKISFFCGDIFDLTTDILGSVDAIYDRAAMISMPLKMRQNYAAKLLELAKSASILLVTLEYEQSKMDGPPFSVSENEINALYGAHYQVNQLSAQDVLGDNEKFRARGLDYMDECIYQMDRMR